MTRLMHKAVILGAGNVAWHLGHCLLKNGITVVQVYNRDPENGGSLALSLKAEYVDSPYKLVSNAGLYVIAISDDAIVTLAKQLSISGGGLLVHTAGSVDMGVLSASSENFGVLYPLQTFTKERLLDISHTPLLIEANNHGNLEKLNQLALKLSQNVYEVCSEDRKLFHLAAVIASNFSNHLMACAERILKERNQTLKLLEPLMVETVAKAFAVSPGKAQTGPAVRNNLELMEKHLTMLKSYPEIKEIYQLLSKNIMKYHVNDKN